MAPPPNYKKAAESFAKQLKFYEDYVSHHNDWVEACKIAEMSCTEETDKSYWRHQLRVLDGIKNLKREKFRE